MNWYWRTKYEHMFHLHNANDTNGIQLIQIYIPEGYTTSFSYYMCAFNSMDAYSHKIPNNELQISIKTIAERRQYDLVDYFDVSAVFFSLLFLLSFSFSLLHVRRSNVGCSLRSCYGFDGLFSIKCRTLKMHAYQFICKYTRWMATECGGYSNSVAFPNNQHTSLHTCALNYYYMSQLLLLFMIHKNEITTTISISSSSSL